MTREQTIEKLKTLYTNAVAAMLRSDACDDDESAKVMTEYAETLDSAITALQTDGDCISRQDALDDIETVDPSMLLDINWVKNWVKTLPSAQPDLSSYSDKLWRNAYERGRAEAQAEIVKCKDCKWYELPSHKITENCVRWMKSNGILLPIKPNDYCSYAERRTDGCR